MIMGGEVYLGDATTDMSWTIGRQLGLQIAAHILSPFGITPTLDKLATRQGRQSAQIGIGPDNLFIHMTGQSDMGWKAVQERRRAGLDCLPDRDEHAARNPADHQDATTGMASGSHLNRRFPWTSSAR